MKQMLELSPIDIADPIDVGALILALQFHARTNFHHYRSRDRRSFQGLRHLSDTVSKKCVFKILIPDLVGKNIVQTVALKDRILTKLP